MVYIAANFGLLSNLGAESFSKCRRYICLTPIYNSSYRGLEYHTSTVMFIDISIVDDLTFQGGVFYALFYV